MEATAEDEREAMVEDEREATGLRFKEVKDRGFCKSLYLHL